MTHVSPKPSAALIVMTALLADGEAICATLPAIAWRPSCGPRAIPLSSFDPDTVFFELDGRMLLELTGGYEEMAPEDRGFGT
jgi:hypothetical protein